MTDLTTLRELEKSLEEATGPDPIIDFHMARMFDKDLARDTDGFIAVDWGAGEYILSYQGGMGRQRRGYIGRHMVAPATFSLVCALTLLDGQFPRCGYLLGRGRTRPDEPLYGAQIFERELSERKDNPIAEAEHEASLAIALLLALIRALIARGEP